MGAYAFDVSEETPFLGILIYGDKLIFSHLHGVSVATFVLVIHSRVCNLIHCLICYHYRLFLWTDHLDVVKDWILQLSRLFFALDLFCVVHLDSLWRAQTRFSFPFCHSYTVILELAIWSLEVPDRGNNPFVLQTGLAAIYRPTYVPFPGPGYAWMAFYTLIWSSMGPAWNARFMLHCWELRSRNLVEDRHVKGNWR